VPFDELVMKADIVEKPLLVYNPNSNAIRSIERIKEIILERYLGL